MYFDQIRMSASSGRHAESVPKNFFYSRVLDKNEGEFQNINPEQEFREEIKELVREQKEQIAKELDDFGDQVTKIAQDVLFPDEAIAFRGPPRTVREDANNMKYNGNVTEHPVLMFPLSERERARRRHPEERSDNFHISILAMDQEDGKKFSAHLKSEMHEISKFVEGYANIDSLQNGGEIVNVYFNSKINEKSNLTDWREDEEDDEFNEEVYRMVNSLTAVSLSNVRIEVDIGDNPDFDVVALPLGGFGSNYAIEVKDLLQEDNNEVDTKPASEKDSGELRNELIRKPKNYAEEADLDLITVVKGLDEDQYESLSNLAESSNVILLNEDNYEDGLNEILFEQSFREMSDFIN